MDLVGLFFFLCNASCSLERKRERDGYIYRRILSLRFILLQGGVGHRQTSRSKYGTKKPKTAAS